MKILLLAPQPFFVERGTPIAVRCLVEVLSARGWQIDLLTFHEGEDVSLRNVRIIRTANLSWVRNIPPGFSLKKLVCDKIMFFKALGLIRREKYDYIHAVEESAFMAAFLGRMYGIPFVYDMDSSMPAQIVEKHGAVSMLFPLMRWFEKWAIRRAAVVLPVCDALDELAKKEGAKKTIVLRDPPAFSVKSQANAEAKKKELGVSGTCFMYIGNLEVYQGVDLLLNSFAVSAKSGAKASLVIIGGTPADIRKYESIADGLGIGKMVRFLGPKPVGQAGDFVAAADVLVSPRITGVNTPMKIYAYLNSGKTILATGICSHTQVLSAETAVLEPADAESFARGITRLAGDAELRKKLAGNALRVAAEKYSRSAFERTVSEFCKLMESITRPLRQT